MSYPERRPCQRRIRSHQVRFHFSSPSPQILTESRSIYKSFCSQLIFFPPCKYNTYMKCWGSVCLDLTTYSVWVQGKKTSLVNVYYYILTGGRYFRLCCTMTVHSSHSCEVFNKTNRLRFEFYKEKVLKLLFGTVGRI